MCEFTDNRHIKKAMNFFQKHNIEDPRHPEIMKRFAYAFKPSHCPVCGTFISESERKLGGRATRSLCSQCYKALITSGISSNCFICGGELPNDKIRAQHHNVREISEHMHDDGCFEYWTLMHNVVVSGPDKSMPLLINNKIPASLLIEPPESISLRSRNLNTDDTLPSLEYHNGKVIKVLE